MKITIENGTDGSDNIEIEEFLEPQGAFYRLSHIKDGATFSIDFYNNTVVNELIAVLKFITSDREVIL